MNQPRVSEEQVFKIAREIPATDARRAYLDEACGDDVVLRHRVAALLRVAEEKQSFLELPAVDDAPTIAGICLAERPGAQIGPYKLLEQIGDGGMGVVFMAEQTLPVQRKVAVKVIRPGLGSPQTIARFEAERQALALMDHPNIAKVLDAGTTPSGQPYFVMELVKGRPITQFCDAHRLTTRQRLELFIPVCQAIQHAHQKGIIHRDVKPSNILIAPYDGQPVVKVIDFGISKATGQRLTEKTFFTEFGALIGTLEYMSPEQAELNNQDIDTRSDIYSLGVLLYELLTGTTPLDRARLKSAAFDEVLRSIREEEPSKPSTRLLESTETLPSISAHRRTAPAQLTRQVRGELDWIVMKALDKSRSRRYETANSLALDVRRYLDDEPVLACPPSVTYQMGKFVRRNKGLVAASTMLVALLTFGVAGTSIGLARAMRAEHAARLAAEAEFRQRQRAELAFEEEARQRRLARQAVDDMYTQVAQKWLSDQPRMEELQREFLEKSLQHYREFVKERSTDPAVQLETAKAYRRMGSMFQKLGQTAEATNSHRQGIAIVEKLATDFPAVRDYREEQASNYKLLGHLQLYSNQRDKAEISFNKAVMILEKLAVDFGEDAAIQSALASSLHNLGNAVSGVFGGERRFEESEKYYSEAIELYRRLIANSPEVADYKSDLGGTLNDSAIGWLLRGDRAAARRLLDEAISCQEAALKLDPRRSQYRLYLSNHLASLAEIAEMQGDRAEAVNTARRALVVQTDLADDFPRIPHYRHTQAERARDLGRLLKNEATQEAETTLRRAVAILEKLSDSFSDVPARRLLLVDCYLQLGLVQEAARRESEAADSYRRALEWKPKAVGPLYCLGRNLIKQQQYAAAEPLLLAAYEGLKQRESTSEVPNETGLTEALDSLVQLYDAWGRPDESRMWRDKLGSHQQTGQVSEPSPVTRP